MELKLPYFCAPLGTFWATRKSWGFLFPIGIPHAEEAEKWKGFPTWVIRKPSLVSVYSTWFQGQIQEPNQHMAVNRDFLLYKSSCTHAYVPFKFRPHWVSEHLQKCSFWHISGGMCLKQIWAEFNKQWRLHRPKRASWVQAVVWTAPSLTLDS